MDATPKPSLEELLAHAGWVRGLAAALVGDASAADDLVQDTWLSALRRPPSEDVSPRPWLARIVTNLAHNRRRGDARRRQRELEAARPELLPGSDAPVIELEMHRALVEALVELDEPLRGTIVRRYFRGLSAGEIASAEGITESAVRQRIQRGLERLRAKLDRQYGERSAWSALLLPIASVHTMPRASVPIASGVGLAGAILMSTTVKTIAAVLVAGGAGFWLWRELEPTPLASPTTASMPSSAAPLEAPATVGDESGRASPSDRKRLVPQDTNATVEVLVLNETTHAPVPGVHVGVDCWFGTQASEIIEAEKRDLGLWRTTDGNGMALFDVPSRRALVVFARDERIPSGGLSSEASTFAPGERRRVSMQVTIGELVSLFGRVLARTGREPIADATARVEGIPLRTRESLRSRQHAVEPVAAELTSNEIESSRCDAQGIFEVRTWSWRQRNLHVRIAAPGYASAIMLLGRHTTSGEAREILLDRSAAIDARVVGAGELPIADAWIDLRAPFQSLLQSDRDSAARGHALPVPAWSARTAADGTCTFEGLPPNVPLHGTVSREGWAAETPIESFVLTAGERRKLEWKLIGGCTLTGRVSNEDGTPAAGVQLWLKRTRGTATDPFRAEEQSSVNGMARTDEAGNYRIDAVSPGRWRLGPAATRFTGDVPLGGALVPQTEVVEIPKDAPAVVHDLVVHPALYIHGTVVDPAGGMVDRETARMNPSVTVATANWRIICRNDAGPGGAFIAGPLAPGKYSLHADCPSMYASSEIVVAEAGDKNVVIALQENAILSGATVDSSTSTRVAARVVARRAREDWELITTDLDDDAAAFQFKCLKPGRYELVARAEDGRIGVVTGIDVRSGETIEGVVVPVGPGGKLRLRYEGAALDVRYRLMWGSTVLASSYLKRYVDKIEPVPLGQVSVELRFLESSRTIQDNADFLEPDEKMIVFTDER